MGLTGQLLGWRSPLCLPPLIASLDRNPVSTLRPSNINASAEAGDIHLIDGCQLYDERTNPSAPSALTMRAFVIDQLSHPSKIELTKDAPEPKMAPDQVLVDVYSAGLNFYDVSTCLRPTSPHFA